MKKLLPILLFFISLSAWSQGEIKAHIKGNIFNLQNVDSVALVQQKNDGKIETFAKAPIDKKGNFDMNIKLPSEDYYVLLVGKTPISLVIRKDADIQIYGDGKNVGQFSNIVNSDESVQLNSFLHIWNDYKHKYDSATAYLRTNPNLQKSIQQSFAPVFNTFNYEKQNFIAENKNNASQIAALQSLDFKTEYNTYKQIVENLERVFPNSPTVKAVRAEYETLLKQMQASDKLAPGNVAPDFTQPDRNEKPTKLSSLRGQYVLLDFWASWCGPCRRENPNVVAAYNKYKDKGFTVMSVSLDKNKEAWLGAIERDQLTWPNHVSDLKSWGNEAAQLYGVHAIPFSVLLDKDGKIIDTNVRGEKLEEDLRQIFGF